MTFGGEGSQERSGGGDPTRRNPPPPSPAPEPEPPARQGRSDPPSLQTILAAGAVSLICGAVGGWIGAQTLAPRPKQERFVEPIVAPNASVEEIDRLTRKLATLEGAVYDMIAQFKRLPQNEPSGLLKSFAKTIDEHELKLKKQELRSERIVELEKRLDELQKRIESPSGGEPARKQSPER